jgi:hypothetical protein
MMSDKNSENKKRKIVRRFRNRNTSGASITQKEQDVYLIDLVLKKLYNEGDKETASLTEDILKPGNVQFTQSGSDRLWDILLSTGLVNPVIGFGRAGSLALTNEGYQLMNKFGSYSNFIQEREKQAQANSPQGMVIPQFILTGQPEDEGDQEEGKSVGKTPEMPASGKQAAAAKKQK